MSVMIIAGVILIITGIFIIKINKKMDNNNED